jgi:hypothetical protein
MKFSLKNFPTQKPPPVCKKSIPGILAPPPTQPCPASNYVATYDFQFGDDGINPPTSGSGSISLLPFGDGLHWSGNDSTAEYTVTVDLSWDPETETTNITINITTSIPEEYLQSEDLQNLCPSPYDTGNLIGFPVGDGAYVIFEVHSTT